MRWQPDQIDLWCEGWARERRKVLGYDLDRLAPHERLGKLSCTLGAVMDDKVGAGERTERVNENGHRNQNWPEVYTGISLDIHRGFCVMRFEWRQVMDAQYVLRTTPTKIKAEFLGIKTSMYWQRFSHMKIFLAGFLQLDPNPTPKMPPRNVETQKNKRNERGGLTPALQGA